MTFEFHSPDVRLVPLAPDHAAALAVAGAESRDTYVHTPVPDGIEEAVSYVEAALAARDLGERMPFAVVWKGEVVGSTSFYDLQPWKWPAGSPRQRRGRPDAVEIGSTWLAASAQRTGCNRRAKLLMLTHAFDHWEVYRVALRTDERNDRSRRAIEALGAKFEGVRRAEKPAEDGAPRNSAWFSILREEWPEVRSKLEARLASGTVEPPPARSPTP